MNAYDFDHTLYAGDSTVDFYRYCVRRRPRVLLALPAQGLAVLAYALRLCDKTRMKEGFYRFLRHTRVDDALLSAFWDAHMGKVRPWYLARKRPDDVVISASPEFLLAPACRRLGIQPPIASRVDSRTGRYEGRNCRGEEKVVRWRARYGAHQPERFYSDSLSDAPMAALAREAFQARGDALRPWPEQHLAKERHL